MHLLKHIQVKKNCMIKKERNEKSILLSKQEVFSLNIHNFTANLIGDFSKMSPIRKKRLSAEELN